MSIAAVLRRGRAAVAAAALFGLCALPAIATIGVSPLRATVAPGDRSAAFTVTNVQGTDLTVQAEVFRWERIAGQDKLTKSDAWILNPPVMTIPGYGSRVIRMALKHPEISAEETSYRLMINEVHAPAPAGNLGVVVKMHVSLPVFIAPVTESKGRPEWSAARDGAKRVIVTVKNVSPVHVHLTGFVLKEPSAKTIEIQAPAYVFAGETRAFTIELPQDADSARIIVQAKTDTGVQTIPVGGP